MTLHISPTIAALIGLPPSLALVLTTGFVIFLFRRDIRQRPDITGALWIPVLWLVMTCSRPVSTWLRLFGLPIASPSVEEGSPIDAFLYFLLITAGLYVLNKRRINWSDVIQRNGWLIVFLAYCFISIVWSDYPFVAFKRWIKILGLPIMALVLFTEPDFEEALIRLVKRSAYVLMPFSVMLIKYYLDVGRKFDDWTGEDTVRGMMENKNMLGCACMILGLPLLWHFVNTRKTRPTRARRNELLLTGGLLAMIFWLLREAHSATSLVCLVVPSAVMIGIGLRLVNKKLVGTYVVVTVIALAVAELTFGISSYVLELLNRNASLTDRIPLWTDILKIKFNRIFGVGFESFWLGPRLERLHEGRAWQPNEAHNGYLETYINLGAIGVGLLVAVLASTFIKIKHSLVTHFEFGRFRLGFLTAILLYNLTEASFRGLHPMWLMFYIVALDYPVADYESAPGDFDFVEGDRMDTEFSYVGETQEAAPN